MNVHSPTPRASLGAPALRFRALGTQASHAYTTPTIELMTEITCDEAYEVRTVTLDVDVRIAAQRRRYDSAEQERLREIFGDASQWGHSLRSLQSQHADEVASVSLASGPWGLGCDVRGAARKGRRLMWTRSRAVRQTRGDVVHEE